MSDSIPSIDPKSAMIAHRAKRETIERNRVITERILPAISLTIERIFSISTNVTCDPEFAMMPRFQRSVLSL